MKRWMGNAGQLWRDDGEMYGEEAGKGIRILEIRGGGERERETRMTEG